LFRLVTPDAEHQVFARWGEPIPPQCDNNTLRKSARPETSDLQRRNDGRHTLTAQ